MEYHTTGGHTQESTPKSSNTVLPICEWIREKGWLRTKCQVWCFSSYHHFKAVRASDFILGLWGTSGLLLHKSHVWGCS